MRTSLLNLDQPLERASSAAQLPPQVPEKTSVAEQPLPVAKPSAPPPPDPAAIPRTVLDQETDFELVFGRRQLASSGLILLVILAIFSGVSYMIGKTAGSRLPAVPESAAAPNGATPAAGAQTANSPAVPIRSTASTAPSPVKPFTGATDQGPLFADAIAGQVYMQVGAIDRGLAGVWAEGLRTHGLKAFVSTGPSDKMWRVLVGPLPDPQSYQRAKDVLDGLGIATFGRRSVETPPSSQPSPPSQTAQQP